jgi:hypothetical protein
MSAKIIKYFIRENYGCVREYIHPDNAGDAKILMELTGKKTVDPVIRELVRDLTGGQVTFQQVLPVF